MPRSHAASPARKYRAQIEAARHDLDSVADSPHPFATAAREGRLKPDSPFDAFTIGFAAAVDETLCAHYAQRISEDPHGRQPERSVSARLGERLGLSGTSVRAARDGDRWVQLPEVLAGLRIVDGFGATLSRHLDVLLREWPYLLHKDSQGHPTLSFTRAAVDPSAASDAVVTQGEPRRLKEKDVLQLEQQVREAVATLVATQNRAALHGRALPSPVDWVAVASLLDPDLSPCPGYKWGHDSQEADPYKTLPDFGIDNLNADVRAVFEDGQSHPACEVISRIQQVGHERQVARGLEIAPVPEVSIRAALWRLHSLPRNDPEKRWLVRGYRTYKPGPRWFRERGNQGD